MATFGVLFFEVMEGFTVSWHYLIKMKSRDYLTLSDPRPP